MNKNSSEVARLREEIELQMQAMQRAMHGFATGSTRHAFIRARMERIGQVHSALARSVGERDADQIIDGLYTEILGQ